MSQSNSYNISSSTCQVGSTVKACWTEKSAESRRSGCKRQVEPCRSRARRRCIVSLKNQNDRYFQITVRFDSHRFQQAHSKSSSQESVKWQKSLLNRDIVTQKWASHLVQYARKRWFLIRHGICWVLALLSLADRRQWEDVMLIELILSCLNTKNCWSLLTVSFCLIKSF